MSGRLQPLVGVMMVIVLAGLPVMATTCEALCEQVPAGISTDEGARTSMHEGMVGCHESPSAPASQRLTGASSHDCNTHDGVLRETEPALTSSRSAGVPVLADEVPTFADMVAAPSSVLSRSPSDSAQDIVRSHVPLVLRI